MVRTLEGKHPNYYEAILQLRDVEKEVKEYVEEELFRIKLPVAKQAKVKNGHDYYLADNGATLALGKRLQERFGGELTKTSSLHTKKDNKELYRVTVLFRQTPFAKNDIVEYQGEEWLVRAMGKDIFLQNKHTGKKIHLKYKNMKEIKKIS